MTREYADTGHIDAVLREHKINSPICIQLEMLIQKCSDFCSFCSDGRVWNHSANLVQERPALANGLLGNNMG